MTRFLRRLRHDQRGATLIEFAIVAPTLLVVIMGLLDMTYRLYATAMLQGEVQKAARDSTLETSTIAANTAVIDNRVKTGFKQINGTVSDSNFVITRRNYQNFTGAGKLEPATGPGGQCATGFNYTDINDSGTWDDGAVDGVGGAKDVTLYTVRVTYRSLFPIQSLIGASPNHVITASTVLRNQPYKDQVNRTIGPTRACA